MSCLNTYVFKTGSPFERLYLAEMVDSITGERETIDLTAIDIQSKSLLNGKPFITFTVTKLDQTTDKGYFILSYTGSTSTWPIGTLKYDIAFNGKHSLTDEFKIEKGIT